MTKAVRDAGAERLPERQQRPARKTDTLPVAKCERHYSPQRGKVVLDPGSQRWQRPSVWQYLKETPLTYVLAAPVIYGMIVPLAIMDVSVTLYQHIGFRIYGIPRVRRLDYLAFDRHRLAYLNAFEKVHCVYCAYAGQLIEYAREVNARSEQFWCPIKHAGRTPDPHHRMRTFVEYGDARAYRDNLEKIRQDWGE